MILSGQSCGGGRGKDLALSMRVVSGKVFNTQKTNDKTDERGAITPHTSTTCACTHTLTQLGGGPGFRGKRWGHKTFDGTQLLLAAVVAVC